jgi:hypothetical protein
MRVGEHIRARASQWRPLVLALALGCAAGPRPFPPPPAGTDDTAARAVLGRFAAALEAGRFDEAHALLSARWRRAYTPGRLALDWRGAGPGAQEAAARVARLLAAGEPLVHGPDVARLPEDAGRAAALVLEGGGWRIDALE